MTISSSASSSESCPARIIVSLSSFGAAEVRRHGQRWFADLCRQAGADGVEVRGELLMQPQRELPELAALLRDTGMSGVYSSPEGLWDEAGALDGAALDRGMAAARALGARVLKMSIGGFKPASGATLMDLKARLDAAPAALLIENDQTVAAGSISALKRFFAAAESAGLPLGMTFDMGNWHWVGESSLRAAECFAARVRYVHCKGVQRRPERWVAVGLADSAAPWRAVFEAMPADAPCAIEYPLQGDDLLAVTRAAVGQLRQLRSSLQ
ncbi:sugar phosphate isomerase/epimerase [Candidimonas humi]|jgi:sugar phosphate isomerase/epimerase|uniref:Sugar phosphate isomerase/epimerase family protein n=1 Tax=Candidimonas humi TaxID=683355 RepID=A0ABV8P220_9BURK|nr:TIM barrel protein [Candidimonas humi]MBV6306505.1 sugar phosphate isomerase/epimerase [Candidimonas humi]